VRRFACLLAALTILGLASSASAAAPRLTVEGKHLVDARTGSVFVPRGVNWPSFEYACYYGYGYSDAADPTTTHPTAAAARAIARWHVNTVRVPLNEACWLGVDGQPAFGTVDGYRSAVRQWVSLLHRAGLAVILDLHWSAPPGVGAESQRAMPDERSDDFWASVATTFKRDHSVVFDLFNEPYSRYDGDTLVFDLTWDCWRDGGCTPPTVNDGQPLDGSTYTALGMQALVDAVREAGATQPIMLAGRDYANDLGSWLQSRPDDDQTVASFHNYESQTCHTTACWNSTIAPIARRVPVVTGELGETDCADSHLKSYMSWADRRGVGYLVWAWWVLRDKSCSALSVLSDQSGTPKAPNGTTLKHLAKLVPPRLTLSGPARQALDGSVELGVRCSRRCRVRVGGRIAAGGRSFTARTVTRALGPGRARTVAVRLPRAARRAAAGDERATATLTVTVGDVVGSTTTRKRKIRLG
jgi:hypothetical protein